MTETRPRDPMGPFHPTDLRFRCPQCGGSAFGSMLDPSDPEGPMQRYCHGNDAPGGRAECHFNWPDKEDWRYFLLDGKPFGTAEEHEAVCARIRSVPVAGLGEGWPSSSPATEGEKGA